MIRAISREGVRALVASWLAVTSVAGMVQESGAAPRTIARGPQSNIDSPRHAVARTPAEWEALWRAHDYDKPAPAVDFSRDMVVAVFMGSRPTGGFAVEITSAAERDGALVVSYRERSPSPGAIAAQVLTFPFHIVAVRKYAGVVRFEKVAN